MASPQKAKSDYSESDIDILEGLEPVQMRPGMYTNTDNPNHILQEVVDNAQDEALAGHASLIEIEEGEDGSLTVRDNGRGIPVGINKKKGVSTLQVVFTELHSGAKFKKGEANSYAFTGGLHGVGVSVTNALSDRMEVTVWRDGTVTTVAFEKGSVVEKPKTVKLPKDQAGRHGTQVKFWPTAHYFEGPLSFSQLERHMRSRAVLLRGPEIVLRRHGKPEKSWSFPGGMEQYLMEQSGLPAYDPESEEEGWLAPLISLERHHDGETPGFDAGEGFDLALGFVSGGSTVKESSVNLINTHEGGTHEAGLRAGAVAAIRTVADRLGAVPKGLKIEPDDVWSKMSFVLSVKLLDPLFRNQTKDALKSEKGSRLVSGFLTDALELWLNDHPPLAQAIVDSVVEAAMTRSRQAVKTVRKKATGASVLPGKLSDCQTRDVKQAELFLVEGDSAAGSAKSGRDRHYQAILPLRGKLLNTWEEDPAKALQSDTVSDISRAIGIDPHTLAQARAGTVDLSKLRYGKIMIMADADVDGQHIQVLLLTLFYRHFPALVLGGNIWIARAPLFRVDAPAKKGSRGQPPRKIYALDQSELEATIRSMEKEGLREGQYVVSRFKGLGEMNPAQLRETTLDPATRSALMMRLPKTGDVDAAFDRMMAKKSVPERRAWMESEGASVVLD